MSGATHTPGPWECISDAAHPANGRITSKARPHVAKVYAVSMDPDAEAMANARLIAAAPELLAALEGLADECDRIGNALSAKGIGATALGLLTKKARAAISRARLEHKDAKP